MPSVDTPAGLCADCQHYRPVSNTRGSVFVRCSRADTDSRYARYPRLPVLECGGYSREAQSEAAAAPAAGAKTRAES